MTPTIVSGVRVIAVSLREIPEGEANGAYFRVTLTLSDALSPAELEGIALAIGKAIKAEEPDDEPQLPDVRAVEVTREGNLVLTTELRTPWEASLPQPLREILIDHLGGIVTTHADYCRRVKGQYDAMTPNDQDQLLLALLDENPLVLYTYVENCRNPTLLTGLGQRASKALGKLQ